MFRFGVLIVVLVSVAPGMLRATTPPPEMCRPDVEPSAEGDRWFRARVAMLLPSFYVRFDRGFPPAPNRRLRSGTANPLPGRLVLATSRTVTWEIGLRWSLRPHSSPRPTDDSPPTKRSEALEQFCSEFAALGVDRAGADAHRLRKILNEEAARQKIDALRETNTNLSGE